MGEDVMEINICASANSLYARYLYVMMISVLENNRTDEVHFWIFQRDFTEIDKENIQSLCKKYDRKVEFITVNADKYSVFPTKNRYSLEAYFRFEILKMIPENIDKVLYFDVDLIIQGSLRELYSISLKNYYFAACSDMVLEKLPITHRKLFNRYDDLRYFNSGMMLWNLKELRGKISWNDFVKAAEELDYNLQYVDQDIFNYLFYDKTLYINPKQFNFMVSKREQLGFNENEVGLATILHYAGCNPWSVNSKSNLQNIWWNYAKKTPFYTELLMEKLEKMQEFISGNKKTGIEIVNECLLQLFHIKGSGKIKKYLERVSEKICLYGGGLLGNLLWETFAADGIENILQFVVDKRGKNLIFHDIPVIEDLSEIDNINEYYMIIALSFDIDIVKGEIDKSGKKITAIPISDFLLKVEME